MYSFRVSITLVLLSIYGVSSIFFNYFPGKPGLFWYVVSLFITIQVNVFLLHSSFYCITFIANFWQEFFIRYFLLFSSVFKLLIYWKTIVLYRFYSQYYIDHSMNWVQKSPLLFIPLGLNWYTRMSFIFCRCNSSTL